MGWIKAILQIIAGALGLANKGMDRQAGIDSAQKQMVEGENVLLKQEVKDREELHAKQGAIASDVTTEQERLRKNPNAVFGEEKK